MARAKTAKKTAKKARPRKGATTVVAILESERPLALLRAFLAAIDETATVQEGQIALGAAQLALAGDDADAAALIELILANWERFPDQRGFHADAFLHNAFASDDDPARLERLLMYATASGIDLVDEEPPPPGIPVSIEPYVRPVRAALDSLIGNLHRLGQIATKNPPASLDDVLDAERARRIQLPNDYRALLTITDGFAIWANTFFGTTDYRSETALARNAREYLEMSARYGAKGMDACVPLANWGQSNDWLLYDPLGHVRRGDPGYVLMMNADETPLDDLVAALAFLDEIASDALATN
ncbi:MAG: SMI1/KNR4 family protein [Kofleriaceae bacterium]